MLIQSNFTLVSGIILRMETQKSPAEKQTSPTTTTPPPITSCWKKKNEQATFLEDVKDHIDEFINASMDEHKSCFKKTVQKVFLFFTPFNFILLVLPVFACYSLFSWNSISTVCVCYWSCSWNSISDVWNVKDCCREEFWN